ncbi:MAG TPA: SDR family oxidoreductase [Candidatus Polarisedimenticolaceae bacterium]|nr:SDR family oxidoreductase [Candidatus Polarisedimenticolaceae bacterium]
MTRAVSPPRHGALVVTGASTGIGEACARHLANLGYRVFAAVRKEPDAETLAQKHPNITPILFDVRDASALRQAAEFVAKEVGSAGIQGLLNNAGIAVAAPLEHLPLEDLRLQLEINVVGQLAVTQAFMPLLRQGRGRITFMSSISGLLAAPIVGAYSASKHAVEALADALRLELKEWGIEVNLVEPGQIATPIWTTSARAADERQGRMAPETVARYGWMMRAARVRAGQGAKHGTDPHEVALAVAKALVGPRPKTRYLVGKDARAVKVIAALPDRLRDRIVLKQVRKMAAAYRER